VPARPVQSKEEERDAKARTKMIDLQIHQDHFEGLTIIKVWQVEDRALLFGRKY
jgi:hypothetical protein